MYNIDLYFAQKINLLIYILFFLLLKDKSCRFNNLFQINVNISKTNIPFTSQINCNFRTQGLFPSSPNFYGDSTGQTPAGCLLKSYSGPVNTRYSSCSVQTRYSTDPLYIRYSSNLVLLQV